MQNAIIFSKQTGEARIPLTVRIEWLPNGSIKPLMYWTQDGICCQIMHVYECTPLAFLKERGEGLRFKVRAEIIEMPEPDADPPFIQYATYLYLAEKRFCERNIVDGRYGHAGKEYIPVTMDVFPDGAYELVYFWVHGARYKVEKTIVIESRGAFRAGGVGLWHKVEARQINEDNDEDADPMNSVRRMAALYFEINKWFVAVEPHDKLA